ncbi:MAG: hypothetical protein JRM95_05475 [Nitrososphaerota archaeon]|nr:hypothetical protein [Nitrososphaerota archaeon]
MMQRPAPESDSDLRRQRAKELSTEIMERHDFLTLMESKEMHVRLNGVYRVGLAESLIESEVEMFEPSESNNFSHEVIGHVRRSSFVPDDTFDRDLDIVNLKNGLYHLSSGKTTAHNPTYPSRVQLPVESNPKATCPNVMRFLKEVLPPDSLLNVLEDAATTLIRDARFQKAFMYLGAGDNGKSVWLGVLARLLGVDNVSTQSIHDLGMSRFGAGNIEGKLAVIYPDIASNEITLTGKLKAIIAGDRIFVEKKGLQGHDITPFCKCFFSANALPIVADDTDAWFRRWRITNWDFTVPEESRNPNLLEELTTPEELSGLFNILAALARRLIAKGAFTYEATVKQKRAEWGNRSNVLRAFISKCLNVGDALASPSSEVYTAYVAFCQSENFTAKKQTGFMEELKSLIPVHSQQARINGRGAKVLVGAELKPEFVSSVSSVSGYITLITPDSVNGGDKDTRNVETPETRGPL